MFYAPLALILPAVVVACIAAAYIAQCAARVAAVIGG